MKAPKNIPLVPTPVRDAIALGNKLYTQMRLLKDRPHRPINGDTHIVLLPSIDDNYVPQFIKIALEEMRNIINNPTLGYGEDV